MFINITTYLGTKLHPTIQPSNHPTRPFSGDVPPEAEHGDDPHDLHHGGDEARLPRALPYQLPDTRPQRRWDYPPPPPPHPPTAPPPQHGDYQGGFNRDVGKEVLCLFCWASLSHTNNPTDSSADLRTSTSDPAVYFRGRPKILHETMTDTNTIQPQKYQW